MKKFLRVFLIFIGVFFLASCGSKIETKTFVGSPQDGIDSTLTYTYQGDKVLTQTAKNIVSYDKLGITKEEAKTALEPVSKQYEDIKGLDYKLTYEDKQAIEKLTINYEKLDYDKAKKVDEEKPRIGGVTRLYRTKIIKESVRQWALLHAFF